MKETEVKHKELNMAVWLCLFQEDSKGQDRGAEGPHQAGKEGKGGQSPAVGCTCDREHAGKDVSLSHAGKSTRF